MKNILLFSLILFAVSCTSNEKSDEKETGVFDLNVDNMKKYLPLDATQNKSNAVFVNSDGEEKVLDITKSESVRERVLDYEGYKTDEISISYSDPEDSNNTLFVFVSGMFSEKNVHYNTLQCGIKQFVSRTCDVRRNSCVCMNTPSS